VSLVGEEGGGAKREGRVSAFSAEKPLTDQGRRHTFAGLEEMESERRGDRRRETQARRRTESRKKREEVTSKCVKDYKKKRRKNTRKMTEKDSVAYKQGHAGGHRKQWWEARNHQKGRGQIVKLRENVGESEGNSGKEKGKLGGA